MRIYKNFKESNNVTLYNGDCRKLLKRLPSESVDLVVTSPPYCIGKAYEVLMTISKPLGNSIKIFLVTCIEL